MIHKIRPGGENNAREMLLALGMGNYNATMCMQNMFIAPAATDPAMPPVILMTKYMQQGLRAAGAADVAVTGKVDDATAQALAVLVGPSWNQMTWYSLFSSVIAAKQQQALELDNAADLSGIMDSVPSLPGGLFTWLAIGGAAYYFLVYKKRH